jgi:hypothetical protein
VPGAELPLSQPLPDAVVVTHVGRLALGEGEDVIGGGGEARHRVDCSAQDQEQIRGGRRGDRRWIIERAREGNMISSSVTASHRWMPMSGILPHYGREAV